MDAPVRTRGFDEEELGGESQFSAEEAGGRRMQGNSHRPSAPPLKPLSATPETLGRRYLEEATESPALDLLDAEREDDELDEAPIADEEEEGV